MITSKYLQESFIQRLGNIRILTRKEEERIFRTIFLLKRRALTHLKADMPAEESQDYRKNFLEAEIK